MVDCCTAEDLAVPCTTLNKQLLTVEGPEDDKRADNTIAFLKPIQALATKFLLPKRESTRPSNRSMERSQDLRKSMSAAALEATLSDDDVDDCRDDHRHASEFMRFYRRPERRVLDVDGRAGDSPVKNNNTDCCYMRAFHSSMEHILNPPRHMMQTVFFDTAVTGEREDPSLVLLPAAAQSSKNNDITSLCDSFESEEEAEHIQTKEHLQSGITSDSSSSGFFLALPIKTKSLMTGNMIGSRNS